MDVLTDIGYELREELMVSPNSGTEPTKRLAHFLKPCTNSTKGQVFDLPSHSLSSVPAVFEPKKWPLVVKFVGWKPPVNDWKKWVEKMAALHESTWKKAGIHEAILSSTYEIKRSTDLVLGLAEKWCPDTKSFIFSWGEATITLEDVMISGYSVLGAPVFTSLETDELKEVGKELSQVRTELSSSAAGHAYYNTWMNKFKDSRGEIEHEAFLSMWLSRFVFPGSSHDIVKPLFPIAVQLARGTRIALAPAVLASIYRDLSLLKEKIVALTELISNKDEDGELKVSIRSPFQLLQVWAWERFVKLRPNPILIKNGEPRFAQWHKLMIVVENVRTVLDSDQECFDWRPYGKNLNNWKMPIFYGENEMTVLVDTDLSEELLSFARCMRVSELVGTDCIEQYLPHRVAMQFGMDQDLPACVARTNESPYIAWCVYSKPISYADLYLPSRLYQAAVTAQYLEWWKQSVLGLQGANGCSLPQERILTSSEIPAKRSKQEKKRMFTSFGRKPERGEEMKGSSGLPRSELIADLLKQTKKRKFIARTKITPRRSDRTKNLDGTLTSPSLLLSRMDNSLEISIQKSIGNDASVIHDSTFKRAKRSVHASEDMKEDSDPSNCSEYPLKMVPLKLVLKKEADNSPVPPGFPLKSNLVNARRDLVEEDKLSIKESLVSSEKQNEFQHMNVFDGQNTSSQSLTLPSIGDNEAAKITEPAEEVTRNETINGGSENAREDVTERGGCGLGHDVSSMQGSNGDCKKCDSEDELEASVSRLERIVAELKAARFGNKMKV